MRTVKFFKAHRSLVAGLLALILFSGCGFATIAENLAAGGKSSLSQLLSVNLSSGILGDSFVPEQTAYHGRVTFDTTSFSIAPEVVPGATLKMRLNPGEWIDVTDPTNPPSFDLVVGTNVIEVSITSEDGLSTTVYYFEIVRSLEASSSDSSLSALSSSEGTLSPSFLSGTLSYSIDVPASTDSLKLTAARNEPYAMMQVRVNSGLWKQLADGVASNDLSLNAGENTVELRVIAQNAIDMSSYMITVNRESSSDAALADLLISHGTLDPAFSSSTTSYTASVLSSTSSLTVTPTVNESHATVQVRVNSGSWSSVASGSASNALNLNSGVNTVSVKVTAQNGTTNATYTISVTKAASTDATLSSLTVSSGTLSPSFDSSTTSYSMTVGNSTSAITVTPTVTEDSATVQVRVNSGSWASVLSGYASSSLALAVGSNTVNVKVTAGDLSTNQTYTLTITRESSSTATLSALTLSSGTLSPTFTSGTTSYTASVANGTTSLTVTPTLSDATGSIEARVNSGSWASVSSGSASSTLALNIGANSVEVKVTAQDGVTNSTYTVTVTRAASADATLSALTLSSGSLSPTFSSGTTSYSASVAHVISSITVTPTIGHAGSTLQARVNSGSWSAVTSGETSGSLALNVGSNTVEVKVTAQDGATNSTYSVSVTRAASSDATLQSLTLSSGTLDPVFASATTSYTASVSNATTSITVTPTVQDSGASVQVKVNAGSWSSVTSGSASSALSLNVGTNTVSVKVTAEDGSTTDTYTVTVSRAASSVASLASLSLSSGTLDPVFSSATTVYSVALGNEVSTIALTPTVTDSTATMQIRINSGAWSSIVSGATSSALALNVGANTVEIKVTAEDLLTIQTYTVGVSRAPSAAASLSDLTLSHGALTPTFVSSTSFYSASVNYATTSLTVSATVSDATSTLQVRINSGSWSALSSGVASSSLSLAVGDNSIDVKVTAADGITNATYTVVVTRAGSSDSSLSTLALSSGTLDPVFNSATTSYAASVSNATTSITVTPTVNESNSTVQVRVNSGAWASVLSGSASGNLSLAVGSNTVEVKVTAQDLITYTTYTLTLTRAASSVSTLSALSLSSGTLSPTFASGTTSYTAPVSNATSSITVTPTKTDSTSTIEARVNSGAWASVNSGEASSSLSLSVGANTVEVKVTAQDTSTTTTYSVTVTRAASSVSSLASLTISSGTLTPSFLTATTSYTASVSNTTSSLTVTPTVTDSNSTIQVRVNSGSWSSVTSGSASGSLSLSVGANTVEVKVTAQDTSTTTTYTLTVTRAASNVSTLAALSLSSGSLTPAFATGTTSYTASVVNTASSITVTPTVTDSTATIQVRVNSGSWSSVSSGVASSALSLNVGSNTVNVKVTAEDTTTSTTYTVTVTRAASSVSSLASLGISSGTLSPTFDAATTGYTATVSNATSSVTVTPTVADSTSTTQVRVNSGVWSSVTSGVASGSLSLSVGSNTVEVKVTAQDLATTTTYTVTVTRAYSSVSTLSSLSLSSGTLSPTFASATTSYTASVSNATSSMTVTPTVTDSAATVEAKVNSGSYSSVTSGSASSSLALNVGANTVSVKVTAQDGSTTTTYTVTVTRAASSVSSLSALTMSTGTLSPTFASATTSYSVSVAGGTSSITVTPTVTDSTATIQARVNSGSWSSVTSGSASSSLSINAGSNTVEVKVTAQDTSTTTTYTITVTAADSTAPTIADATITSSGLTAAAVTLSWKSASDETTVDANLQYKIVRSLSNNLTTVTNAENNGTVTMDWTAGSALTWTGSGPYTTTYNATSLSYNTQYYFNILVKDAAGNKALYTSKTITTNAGPTIPTITTPSAATTYSSSNSFTISGGCTTGNTVTLSGSGSATTTCSGSNTYSFSISNTTDGTYVYFVSQTDGTFISGTATRTWVRDATVPAAPQVTSPVVSPFTSSETTLTITGYCEAGATVTIAGSATGGGTCPSNGEFSYTVAQGASGTSFTYTLTQTDLAGNVSGASTVQWDYDSTLPATPTVTAPASIPSYSNASSMTISGGCTYATGVSVEITGDLVAADVTGGSLTATCSASGTYSFVVNKTTDGTYNFNVHQVKAVTTGTGSNAVTDYTYSADKLITWVRDTINPASIVLSNPYYTPYTSSGNLLVQGPCETGATVTLTESPSGTVSTASCSNYAFTITVSKAADASFTYTIKQTDRAGNNSPNTSFAWTRDSTYPATPTVTSPSANPYYSKTTSLTISGGCTTGLLVTIGGDAVASDVTSPSNSLTTPCSASSYSFTLSKSANQRYDFSIKQTNASVDSARAGLSWIRDAAEPDTTITSSPSATNYAALATFAFTSSKSNSTFECKMDTGAYAACVSPVSYSGLSNGSSHTFNVRAIDQYANVDSTPASATFTQSGYSTVALYHFDTSSGVTYDSAPLHVNTLTDSSTTSAASAKFNQGRTFGVSKSMSAASHDSLQQLNSQMTIDFWLSPGSYTNNKDYIVAAKTSSTSTQKGWRLKIRRLGSNYYLVFQMSIDGSTWATESKSTGFSWNAGYNHLAVTWNKGLVKFFQDGVARGSGTIGTLGGSVIFSSTGSFYLGTQPTMDANDNNLDGTIDEFRLSQGIRWSTAFTKPSAAYAGTE